MKKSTLAITLLSALILGNAALAGSDIQQIKTVENRYGYAPKNVTVKKGVPVSWTISVSSKHICSGSIVAKGLGISKKLKPGKNTISFKPAKAGRFEYSCSTGKAKGYIEVTDQNNGLQTIKSTYTAYNDILPNSFTVKVNRPVRFIVYPKDTEYGCMSTITIPGLYEDIKLIKANQPITMDFTPTKTGEFQITCAMGIPRGIIYVTK